MSAAGHGCSLLHVWKSSPWLEEQLLLFEKRCCGVLAWHALWASHFSFLTLPCLSFPVCPLSCSAEYERNQQLVATMLLKVVMNIDNPHSA